MLSGMALKQSGAKKASARPLRLSERSGGTVCAEFGTVWCMFMGYFLVGAYSRPALGDVACGEWHGLALPLRPNSVPTLAMVVAGNAAPLLLIAATEALNALRLRRLAAPHTRPPRLGFFAYYASHALNLFWLGQFTVVLATELAKRWTGRLRPHFLAVCQPNLSALAAACANRTSRALFTGGDFCSGDPRLVAEARLSFPSGHASFTTYVTVYLIVYLEMRLFVSNSLHFPKRLAQVALFLVCSVVLLSRFSDCQHHASDIVAGFSLGLAAATCAFYVGRSVWLQPTGLHYQRRFHDCLRHTYLSINDNDDDDDDDNDNSSENSAEKMPFS